MPEYLTPEEVELWARGGSVEYVKFIAGDTLRAYAKVVEAVAERAEPIKVTLGIGVEMMRCEWCLSVWSEGKPENHDMGCAGLLARELRGHADLG